MTFLPMSVTKRTLGNACAVTMETFHAATGSIAATTNLHGIALAIAGIAPAIMGSSCTVTDIALFYNSACSLAGIAFTAAARAVTPGALYNAGSTAPTAIVTIGEYHADQQSDYDYDS
jgi:hypothetical protein